MKPGIGKGDSGKTRLFSRTIDKSSPIISLIGSLDYLNSLIGLARAFNKDRKIDNLLEKIQSDIFTIGSELAGSKKKHITKKSVKKLENFILKFEKQLPRLNRFIYPTGSKSAALLHVARSFCRKVESEAFSISKKEKISKNILSYLNRLSDLLFVLARIENKNESIPEKTWA